MKTTFLKSTMPFALVAVMGISGAFLTTSMQSASKAAPKTGYINSAQLPCNVPVSCDTTPRAQICQSNGQQAFGKDNNCQEVLYRAN